MILLYIPGFGSNDKSNTFLAIKNNITECNVQCLQYDNINPINAKNELTIQIEKYLSLNNEIILIGSSLGGYWTNYFSQKYKLPCFLINPSLFPMQGLKKYNIDDKYLQMYQNSKYTLCSRTIFLGIKDTIVNNKQTEEIFKNISEVIWLNEDHRLTDYTPVINKIKYYINNVQEI